jgi:phosphoserine phosphatase RsbU/P
MPKQETPICVLLVEDNPGDARLLQELIADSRTPFEIECVDRMSRALARLDAGGIRLVLSDLTLPDSQGLETFHTLHAHAPQTPIIVLSGLDDEALALETVEKGAQDYLVKGTFDTNLLTRAMRYAITRGEAERALGEERNLLRAVIDNQLDTIYVKDLHGRYILDNIAHMRSLGVRSIDEVIGKTVFDYFPKEIAIEFNADDEVVMRTGQSIVNREEVSLDAKGNKRWLATTKVPLRNREGEIIGLVGIGRDVTARKNAEEQLAKYNQELREKNTEMQDDLKMAREIQEAFIPQQYPAFPGRAPAKESALRFYSRYLPTATVGGDFFHILQLSDTMAGVFICDVMGHGVRAALVTAIQRALVEELASVAERPDEFLTQINRALISILRRTRTPMFVSAFYLVADLSSGVLRYANAGHPNPLHLRRDKGVVEFLSNGERPGPALGVFEDSVYRMHETTLDVHDFVMLFTDGLFEVEGEGGDYYDQQQLVAAVRRRRKFDAPQLFDELLKEINDFSATKAFIDDVCLVGMEVERLGVTADA